MRPGDGTNGSDRVTMIWTNNNLDAVVDANEAITVELENQSEFASRFGASEVLLILIGLALAIRGIFGGGRLWLAGGFTVILGSLLSMHGGATVFLFVVGFALVLWWLPQLLREIRVWAKRRREAKAKALELAKQKAKEAASAAGASMLALMMWLAPGTAEAAPDNQVKAAESVHHEWDIREDRLYGSVDITLSGEAGDRYLLLEHPAVLNEFTGNGLKVINGVHGNQRAYWLVATELTELILPEGQNTVIFSTIGASPNPKCIVLSTNSIA